MNEHDIVYTCFICKKNGRKSNFPDDNTESNSMPVIRYHGWSRNCCKKDVWVHDKCQPNNEHVMMDCDYRFDQHRLEMHQKQLCFVCGKRLNYNWLEIGAIGALGIVGLYMVGKLVAPSVKEWWMSLLIGSSVVFVGGLCFSLVFGVCVWFRMRNSDAIDDQ